MEDAATAEIARSQARSAVLSFSLCRNNTAAAGLVLGPPSREVLWHQSSDQRTRGATSDAAGAGRASSQDERRGEWKFTALAENRFIFVCRPASVSVRCGSIGLRPFVCMLT